MTDPTPPSWERATLEKIALKALDEQRRARQWSILFKLLWFTLVFLVLAAALGWIGGAAKEPVRTGKHTALVELRGVIGVESKASAAGMIQALGNRAQAIVSGMPARARSEFKNAELRKAMAVPRVSFESSMRSMLRRALRD